MPRVLVKLLGPLGRRAGWYQKIVALGEGARVKDLLERLVEEKPELRREMYTDRGELAVAVLVNGRNTVFLDGEETVLRDGDTVAIIPPAGGG